MSPTPSSTTLQNTKALVLGGAGEVGEGIVRQLLDRGATVAAVSRSSEKLEALQDRLNGNDRLVSVTGDVGSEDGAAALAKAVAAELGTPDAVIASLGGWWQGKPVVEIDLELWQRLLDNSLTSHFLAAKTFLPMLADRSGSSYTMINGAGAMYPVPTAGPIVASAAGQLMLGRVLAAEHQDRSVRINMLVLNSQVVTRSSPAGRPGQLSADDAGAYVSHLVAPSTTTRGETIVFDKASQVPNA